jgi:hypothetical protein
MSRRRHLLAAIGVFAILAVASSAQGAPPPVVPGETTAFLTVVPLHAGYQVNWSCNTVGWNRGKITLSCTLTWWGGNQIRTNTCSPDTQCSLPSEPHFSGPNQWTVDAEGCGPGGCTTDEKIASGGVAAPLPR